MRQITTTAFKIDFIDEAIGTYLFTKPKITPTIMMTITIVIKDILYPFKYLLINIFSVAGKYWGEEFFQQDKRNADNILILNIY